MFIFQNNKSNIKEAYLKIPIIKESALEYWLDGTERYYYLAPEMRTIEKDFDFKIDETFAKNLSKEYNLTLPLHIMVPENHRRNKKINSNLYRWIKNIPPKSFIRFKDRGNSDENIYVACPELTFFLASNLLSLAETVMIGNMLCATYVFDNELSIKQKDREPVTSVKKIRRYLERLENVKGIKKALQAASYIVDNCYSPREVELATIAALPIRMGGYDMPLFEMNGKVVVKNEFMKGLGRKDLHCDLVWENEKIVVEYESDMTHLEKGQHRYDKKRSTALIGSGYKVIYITNSDVNSFSKIDDTFFMLRKLLHVRRNQKEFNYYLDIRYRVYNLIFRKNYFHEMVKQKYSKDNLEREFMDDKWGF